MKHQSQNFLIPGIPLLVFGILFSSMTFKKPPENVEPAEAVLQPGETTQTELSRATKLAGEGSSEPPAEPVDNPRAKPLAACQPDTAAVTSPMGIRFEVRAVSPMQPDSETGYELRSERRELSRGIPEFFRGESSQSPQSLDFPLFDGRFIHLQALRHQPMGMDQGVVLANAEGEPEGGHVLLSYVGPALAGMIHLPSRGEFYEIRTGPDGQSHILTRLDPAKMPVCGGCPQLANE